MNGNAAETGKPRPMSSERQPPLACSVRPLNHEIREKQREKKPRKSALVKKKKKNCMVAYI